MYSWNGSTWLLQSTIGNSGIKFGNGASTLTYYEEGTWTPVLSGSGGGTYTMGGINYGKYTRIGNQVSITCTVEWTGVSAGYSGNLTVGGLPFTCAGNRCSGSLMAVLNGISFTSGYGEWNIGIDPGRSDMWVIQSSSTGSGYSHNPTVASSGRIYAISITYFIS
jgi:hypothetical protein